MSSIKSFVELASLIYRELYYKDIKFHDYFSAAHLDRVDIRPYEIISSCHEDEDYRDFYLIMSKDAKEHIEPNFVATLYKENDHFKLFRYVTVFDDDDLDDVEILEGENNRLKNLFTYTSGQVCADIYGFTTIDLNKPFEK